MPMTKKSAPRAAKDTEDRVRTVRLVRLANILRRGRPVSRKALEEELEVARATLTRDLAVLRDQLNMPIVYDRMADGYVLADKAGPLGPRYELPGVWLSESQAYAVLTLTNVLMALGGDILGPTLLPLRMRVKGSIGLRTESPPPIWERISIEIPIEDFSLRELRIVAEAMYSKKQASFTIAGTNGGQKRFSLQRFALTARGWHVDAYSEGEGTVFRIPISSVRVATLLKPSATQLEWVESHWEDVMGRKIAMVPSHPP